MQRDAAPMHKLLWEWNSNFFYISNDVARLWVIACRVSIDPFRKLVILLLKQTGFAPISF